ncbi:hypothetical protein [Flavobacterium sp.]|uniref:hypothetical protein n=1 Tax=Flavobacterium sp. TaxID=239 RepID=UPI00286C6C3E|nr:hypothetical protein [Flavobacterium sp.]
MVTIKINERTKNGKTLLALAKKLSLENKSIIIQENQELLSIDEIVLECRKARKTIAKTYNAE